MSSDFQIDIDSQTLNKDLEFKELNEQNQILREYRQQQEQTEQEEFQEQEEQLGDPRNEEGGGGLRGFGKEFTSAITGGIQDTASSIVTLPERAMDMISGEMVEEDQTEEGYGAEWDDWFVNDANPIETKTWWGGALRSLVHFGTMAGAIVGASVVAAKTGIVTLPAGLVALASKPLIKGAAIGAASDLASKYSQEENGLQILRDRFNFIDTPLTTNDIDHPAMKTLKNVVEGMGIGLIFDGVSMVIGRNLKKTRINQAGEEIIEDGTQDAVLNAVAREQNVQRQVAQKGQLQAISMRSDQYGAYKNKPISDPWQASPTSTGKPVDIALQRQKIETDWSSQYGSTDSLWTPVQVERSGRSAQMAESQMMKTLEEFMSDPRIEAEIALAKKEGTSLFEKYEYAAAKAKEMIEGRNITEMTPEEFWKEQNLDFNVIEGRKIWKSANVVVGDLVVGALIREIRDMGIMGREIFDIADLADVDGPAKALYEHIVAGLTQIKLQKMTLSAEFRGLGARDIYANVDEYIAKTSEAWNLAFKIAQGKDDRLFRAIYDTISMSNDIHNLTDFDAWLKKKLFGGELDGKVQTGVLIKELQGVMINSVLSGPKTPMRAIMGTGTATFLRPFSQIIGSTLTGDVATQRASLAAMSGMIESIPEAWKVFTRRVNGYWSGELATMKTRYNEVTKADETWEMLRSYIEDSGKADFGERAAFYLANMARSANDNKFLTYSTKLMAATDDTFSFILARARAKEKAMRLAMDQFNKGNITEITPEMLKNAQDRFYSSIMDADGNITDAATLFAKKEATLTTDLTGFAKALNATFDKVPWAKPFFLFARTGVNGLALTAKHTPLFNRLIKEVNDIARATPNDLKAVKQYGIETAADLANAKALQLGRQAIGSSVIFMAALHFMNGGLTGNGPADRKQRQVWIDAGYKPRTITIGGVQVSYDAFEPFNLILSTIADIGDYSQLMGEEWTTDHLQKIATVVAQAITSKSYLAGLQQFTDMFTGDPSSFNRILAGFANNAFPLSSLRNELGKLLNPYMKELNAGIIDSVRNRNLLFEYGPGQDIPTKYDLLNGEPIKDWDFPTRMFNLFSPVQFNLEQSEGRKLLFESKYDMRLSVYSSPDGLDLSSSPLLRSLFQQAIGKQNLEAKLNELANDPKILASIAQMNEDLNAGRREINPKTSYYHNLVIDQLFREARKRAWAEIREHPEAIRLYNEDARINLQSLETLQQTRENFTPESTSFTTTKTNNLLLPNR